MACYKIHGTEDAVSEESSKKGQPQTVSNDAPWGRTNQEPVKIQIRKRKWAGYTQETNRPHPKMTEPAGQKEQNGE